MRILYLAPFLIAAPAIVFAAAPKTFQELANTLVLIMNNAVIVLIVLGLVVYFWGVSTNLFKAQEKGSKELNLYLVWGVIILFVMVSVWGILQLLQNSLFGGDQFNNGGTTQTQQGTGSFVAPGTFQ
jgi:hypothetical protein